MHCNNNSKKDDCDEENKQKEQLISENESINIVIYEFGGTESIWGHLQHIFSKNEKWYLESTEEVFKNGRILYIQIKSYCYQLYEI